METEKKLSRKQIIEKKKAINETIKAACYKDHLSYFPDFMHYKKDGLSVYLKSGNGDKLASSFKHYIQNLLKANMEGPFGSEWTTEEKVKRKEMVSPEAHYIFVHEVTCENIDMKKASTHCANSRDRILGFVHYRFVLEEEIPVLYVYELQLDACVQRKGLGEYLMKLIELIAQKSQMGAVVLTVQKSNLSAIDFYVRRLRYGISANSPSRCDPVNRADKSYEILCKSFNQEAKEILERTLSLYQFDIWTKHFEALAYFGGNPYWF